MVINIMVRTAIQTLFAQVKLLSDTVARTELWTVGCLLNTPAPTEQTE